MRTYEEKPICLDMFITMSVDMYMHICLDLWM